MGGERQLQRYIFSAHLQRQDFERANGSQSFRRFEQLLYENGHARVHVLKVDIEGGEYSVFADILTQFNSTKLPYQISFESHWWNRDIYHAILHQHVFAQLWQSGYRFMQHELNPWDNACVEWTLMRVFC